MDDLRCIFSCFPNRTLTVAFHLLPDLEKNQKISFRIRSKLLTICMLCSSDGDGDMVCAAILFVPGIYIPRLSDLIAEYRLYSVHIYVSFHGNKTTPILSIGNQTNSRKDARACIIWGGRRFGYCLLCTIRLLVCIGGHKKKKPEKKKKW